jgi:hypothetical protein
VDEKISQRNHCGSVPAAAFAVQAEDDSTMCFGHCVIWFASSLLGHEWRGGELVFSPESLGQVSAVIAPSPPLSSGPSLSPAW